MFEHITDYIYIYRERERENNMLVTCLGFLSVVGVRADGEEEEEGVHVGDLGQVLH